MLNNSEWITLYIRSCVYAREIDVRAHECSSNARVICISHIPLGESSRAQKKKRNTLNGENEFIKMWMNSMQQKAATTWTFSLKREANESAQHLSSNTRIISISYRYSRRLFHVFVFAKHFHYFWIEFKFKIQRGFSIVFEKLIELRTWNPLSYDDVLDFMLVHSLASLLFRCQMNSELSVVDIWYAERKWFEISAVDSRHFSSTQMSWIIETLECRICMWLTTRRCMHMMSDQINCDMWCLPNSSVHIIYHYILSKQTTKFSKIWISSAAKDKHQNYSLSPHNLQTE